MSDYREAHIGNTVRIGRLIQRNGAFADWRNYHPTYWLMTGASSAFQRTAETGLVHSADYSAAIPAYSGANYNLIHMFPDGRNHWSIPSEPMDYYLDGKEHTVKMSAWVRPLAASTGDWYAPESGFCSVRMTVSGSHTEITDPITDVDEWQYRETAQLTFTGSNYMYGAIRRWTQQSSGTIFVAEAAVIMDEMELAIDAGAKFQGFPGNDEYRRPMGISREHLYEKAGFSLPLVGVTEEQAETLNSWYRLAAPLTLRFSTDSDAAPPFSLFMVGKYAPASRVAGSSDRRGGTIVLEGM